LENLGVHERIILKIIFNKWDGGAWTGLSWLRIGTAGRICECDNEPQGSIKFGEFLDRTC
jgi:hypothetical protein